MSMLVSLIDWLLKVQTRKVKKSSNPYKNLSVHQFFATNLNLIINLKEKFWFFKSIF